MDQLFLEINKITVCPPRIKDLLIFVSVNHHTIPDV